MSLPGLLILSSEPASIHLKCLVVLVSQVTSCTLPRLLKWNKSSTKEGGWVGMVGIWWCWDVRRNFEKGRRPSHEAKVTLGRACWMGCARTSLGVWYDGGSFFTCLWFLLHMLGRQLRLGPLWHPCGIGLIVQNKLFPAIPCPTVIRYGNHRGAGLNRVAVHLSSCSFAAELSLAHWACLEFPQVVLVAHNVEGRCWEESCGLPVDWESEGREVNAR